VSGRAGGNVCEGVEGRAGVGWVLVDAVVVRGPGSTRPNSMESATGCDDVCVTWGRRLRLALRRGRSARMRISRTRATRNQRIQMESRSGATAPGEAMRDHSASSAVANGLKRRTAVSLMACVMASSVCLASPAMKNVRTSSPASARNAPIRRMPASVPRHACW
jgi:hypothetical protein